ncbi:hypothetical protein LCGC14_1245140 [marine sediment metagenome]|uniref:Uncharacterized protein n=1 Tax=marine sediment metagenome TaxID=412755 RepID=A0A0F9LRN0_9ZZZZ
MKEKIVQWDGVIVSFKDEYDSDSWEDTQDEEYIKEVKYYCYKCFSKASLASRKSVVQINAEKHLKCYNRAIWDSHGYPMPMYTEFCSHCNDTLDIQSEYCCISHQTQISFSSSEEALKIMAQQITEEQVLCAYLVLQAVAFYNVTRKDVRDIIELGRYHISRFEATPSGIMLQSLEE